MKSAILSVSLLLSACAAAPIIQPTASSLPFPVTAESDELYRDYNLADWLLFNGETRTQSGLRIAMPRSPIFEHATIYSFADASGTQALKPQRARLHAITSKGTGTAASTFQYRAPGGKELPLSTFNLIRLGRNENPPTLAGVIHVSIGNSIGPERCDGIKFSAGREQPGAQVGVHAWCSSFRLGEDEVRSVEWIVLNRPDAKLAPANFLGTCRVFWLNNKVVEKSCRTPASHGVDPAEGEEQYMWSGIGNNVWSSRTGPSLPAGAFRDEAATYWIVNHFKGYTQRRCLYELAGDNASLRLRKCFFAEPYGSW